MIITGAIIIIIIIIYCTYQKLSILPNKNLGMKITFKSFQFFIDNIITIMVFFLI